MVVRGHLGRGVGSYRIAGWDGGRGRERRNLAIVYECDVSVENECLFVIISRSNIIIIESLLE